MKKTFVMILMATAAIGFAGQATAATPEAKATYKAANDSAAAEYKVARAKCDSMTGNPKDVCIAEAKAARVLVEANAKAQYKDTLSARAAATKDIADANYDVAKAKCGSQTGNAKDVCIKDAKANKVAAVSNAKADKKVIEARTDARDDKNTAEYKVVLEKCDASTGAAKDACVAAAKKQFGK
ncbi:MAG: hypothetical protein Q7T62_01760 [Undibacterium sp.]|nr:hypothetical protein [Undibacterium sp.]